MTVKIVLFGLGNMGRNHLRVLDEDPNFELVAVVDPAKQTLPCSIRSKPHFFSHYDALDGLDFDAAVVATPTQTHYELVHRLLQNKKHVLVEKPIATHIDECRALSSLAKKQNSLLCVGNIERCNPVVKALKDVLASNLIGTIIHIQTMRCGRYPANVHAGNNVLLDLAIHEFDILQMLFHNVHIANAFCHFTKQDRVIDSAEILMQCSDAITCSVHVNWLTPTKTRTMRLTGTQGVCILDYIEQSCHVYGDNVKEKIPQNFLKHELVQDTFCEKLICNVEKKEPLKEQLRQFFAFLQGKEHCLCHDEEMGKSLWLVEECIKKAHFVRGAPQASLETLLNSKIEQGVGAGPA